MIAAAMPRTSTTPIQDPAWSIPGLREPRYSQSLERGLAILRCFTPTRPVMGIADIADELDMSRSTTHRYVITLLALGYLEQGASRKYRLGTRVIDLGMSALDSGGLRAHSHPHLLELREGTGYTANLAVLDESDIVYIDRARSFRRGQSKIDLGLHPGSRLPAYCTAMGKILLANLGEDEQRELLAELKPTKRGPNTITSKKALREALEEVREANLAVNDRGARARAVLDRRARALPDGRGHRRREPGRACLDDLAAGPPRAAPAASLHGRPDLSATWIQVEESQAVPPSAGGGWPDRSTMNARRYLTLLCAPALATGLAACATTVSTSSFKGEQQKVAQTISNLQSDATALEAKKICGQDLAAANVASLNRAGGCKKAIEEQLKQIDNFDATVESVKISGDHATAQVKSVHAGKKAVQTLTLIKEDGKWRISGVVS